MNGTFRVFVSSTFKGLEAERAALHERVFPKLERVCLQRGARFEAVDLRWGVSTAAMHEYRTVPICLEEVTRCQRVTSRPNFIALLGDRYGSRPLPPQIPDDEFGELQSHLSAADRALVRRWYERDDNARPAEWCLWPPWDRSPTDLEIWTQERKEQEERAVHWALREAVGRARFPETALRRYVTSLTEQEIVRGVLDVPEPLVEGAAFGFFRRIDGLPEDAGAGRFADLDGEVRDRDACRRLDQLKERVRERLGGNVHDYVATWAGAGPTLDHIDELCADVEAALTSAIEQELGGQATAPQADDLLREEGNWHDTFGQRLTSCFTGRDRILRQIGDHLRGASRHPLVVVGESGVGKSALVARAAQQARSDHPTAAIVVRFIGATPASSDEPTLLASLNRDLLGDDADPDGQVPVPATYEGLVAELAKRLEPATAQRRLLVFLDALDQLSDTAQAHGLPWLPANLPDHVSLIVSTSPGWCSEALRGRLPASSFVPLERLPADEGAVLLRRWLEHAGRTLRDHQRDEVLDSFAGKRAPEDEAEPEGLPLHLRLAFEEARRWRSFTPADRAVLQPGVDEIIRRNLLARLSGDADHGKRLVAHSLAYLAAARHGLSEAELLAVLSRDSQVMKEARARTPKDAPSFDKLQDAPSFDKLPRIFWSRLYYDLEPYLSARAADGALLLRFYHRQLADVIKEVHLKGDSGRERHQSLARYFADQDLESPVRRPTLRKLAELPYQQAHGGLRELLDTLTDFGFLERKATDFGTVQITDAAGRPASLHTGVFLLQEDFTLVQRQRRAEHRRPLVVTAVDTGDGLQIRCPRCLRRSPVQTDQLGQNFQCPQPGCHGVLQLNPFVSQTSY